MSRTPLSPLAFALAGSALLAQAPTLSRVDLARAKAQQPARVAAALAHLRAETRQLGLGDQETLQPRQVFTNRQGQTIVHLDHTFQGHRIWGSHAVAKVDGEGHVSTRMKAGPRPLLPHAPTLSADEATRVAVSHLGLTSPQRLRTDAQLVVFPMRYRSEQPILGQAASKSLPKLRHDPRASMRAYTWAYEVKVGTNPRAGRSLSEACLVDATTGEVLRVNDLQHRFTAPSAPSVPTPATGTGHGYYNGTVSIPTTQMTDGTFALWDTTRGSLDNPALPYSTQGDGTLWSASGNQVWYSVHDSSGSWLYQDYVFQANATNTWGDGLSWPTADWGNESGTHGQTVGVDAMFGLTTTWDFYKNVLGRSGLDGNDTTIFAAVIRNSDYDPTAADLGYFDTWNWGLFLGAGAYDPTTNPTGQLSQTDLDIIAHEMTHGVTATTAGLIPAYDEEDSEEPGLDEGTADFFAQMVKAYATRGAGADDTVVPATGADWTMGAGTNRGTPLRWLTKPSKDGLSADYYYDGILFTNGHYSGGVLSRALCFLAGGASSSTGSDTYSPMLPGGMAGLGNDKAARIWFKALTEDLVGPIGTITFMDARNAALQAATDLYGAGAEVDAVMDAFAAVNIGDAHNQATPRTKVSFAHWRNGDYAEMWLNTAWANCQTVALGETAPLGIQVDNATNTHVTWSLGGPSMFHGTNPDATGALVGGTVNADGTWTAPAHPGKFMLTATSVAAPLQFAEGKVRVYPMDLDGDNEQDALDLGAVAFSWNQDYGLTPSVFNISPFIDDDVVFIVQDLIHCTWPVK